MEDQFRILLKSINNIYTDCESIHDNDDSLVRIGQSLSNVFLKEPSPVESLQSFLGYSLNFNSPFAH